LESVKKQDQKNNWRVLFMLRLCLAIILLYSDEEEDKDEGEDEEEASPLARRRDHGRMMRAASKETPWYRG